MPYTVRITHLPAAGKAADLRAALEEHTKAANAAGGRYTLSQRLYTTEPAFINTYIHDSLASLEAYLASMPNDPAGVARRAKIGEYVAQPQTSELFETLVPPQLTGAVNYVLRVTLEPALGKGPELRQALEKRATAGGRGVVGRALATQVAPPDGANFVLSTLFPSLAALGESREANQTDASFQAYQAQIQPLLGRPSRQELMRTLVPYPAP